MMAWLFLLASLLVVTLGNLFVLRSLRHVRSWSERRAIQCLILALPLLSLGIGVSAWCFHSLPRSWVGIIPLVPSLLLLSIALGALLLSGIRLVVVARVLARYQGQEDPLLQACSQPLLQQLSLPPLRILRCAVNQPLALTWGIFRPTVLISSWMVEHLDAKELEAVLAHELQHIAQRDSLIIWLATLLRDAFCYVPTSWSAYGALQREKEVACDDLTVQVTRRPLALASALTKVWLYVLEQGTPTSLAGTQALEGERLPLLNRIERLRCRSATMRQDSLAPDVPDCPSRSPLFLLVPVVALFFLLTLLGCGSLSLIFSFL